MKITDLVALLESDGWRQVRKKGSHRQFHRPSGNRYSLIAHYVGKIQRSMWLELKNLS
jgi:predicted RNA binding protein YcfA (HicA-like mRNA interferase family)